MSLRDVSEESLLARRANLAMTAGQVRQQIEDIDKELARRRQSAAAELAARARAREEAEREAQRRARLVHPALAHEDRRDAGGEVA